MIPICIISLYFLLGSVMYVPEITGMEGTGLVLFIPIFAIICIGNIVVHIIAGLLGAFSKNNELSYKDVFYKKVMHTGTQPNPVMRMAARMVQKEVPQLFKEAQRKNGL